MESNQPSELLDRRHAEAQKALDNKDYREASRIYLNIREICRDVWKHVEDAALKLHWEGHIHMAEARRNSALYLAEKAEGGSPDKLRESAATVIQEAKLAIQCFRDQDDIEQSYRMLFNGYNHLLDLQGAQANVQGLIDTLKQKEEYINNYRKFAPQKRVKLYLFELYQTRALTSIGEGLQALFWEMDHLAAQKSFKMAEQSLQDARKETTDKQEIANLEKLGPIIKGLSDFGEGLGLQERGAYREAMRCMKQAEGRLKQSDELFYQAFSKWARASYHFCLATASELDGMYEVAVREYGKASQAFSEASDAFPMDTGPMRSLGSKVRFSADAAKSRQEAAKARPEWKKRELQKGKRIAGLIFFGLWLTGLAVIIVAIKTLALSIDALMFFFLLLLTFTSAALAAALIKPKEAFDFLRELVAAVKGTGQKTKTEDKTKENK